MIEHLLAPQSAPFFIALCVMLLIALMESISLFFGVALSGLIDSLLPDLDLPDGDLALDADADVPELQMGASGGPFTELLGWLCIGKVPALVLLVAFLTAFGLAGLIIQSVANGIAGFYLPSILAVGAAGAAAVPATRYLGLGLARIMPKVETQAVSRDDFVGKVAVITRGVARRGLPAEGKLKDRYGQTHYILVEPDLDGEEFKSGTEVLLVRRVSGTFRAIENMSAALSRSGPSAAAEI